MSDEVVMRAQGRLEARERDRENHLRWGDELVRRRSAAALVVVYDPSARPVLDAILAAIVNHARALEHIDAEIAAERARLSVARHGLKEREARRLTQMAAGAKADFEHLARVNEDRSAEHRIMRAGPDFGGAPGPRR